ncbi:hypothetical protein AVDCRST_MAG84-2550, partial [uncultured Microcoleus sp.]
CDRLAPQSRVGESPSGGENLKMLGFRSSIPRYNRINRIYPKSKQAKQPSILKTSTCIACWIL